MAALAIKIMNLDSSANSHPISVEVNNPDEINQIFDGITYGKGASVIRMMNYFLSESVFKNGLSV
jgi:aminopeptidase N